jgi:surface polysaccharide O-acyltransferase-like enzyme
MEPGTEVLMNKSSASRPRIERLDLIMFPLIVAIVFIHSYNRAYTTMGSAAMFVRNFISYGLSSIAVPTFFLISGFLFFYELELTCPPKTSPVFMLDWRIRKRGQ